MYLDYTEEQLMIRQMARDFAEKELTPLLEEYDFSRPLTNEEVKEVWKRLTPAIMRIVGDFDFSELDYISAAIMAEEFFKVSPELVAIFGISVAPAVMIHLFGTEQQKKKYYNPILSGEKIGCFAITEPNVGSNPAEVEATAVLEGDNYIVNGTKTWISNGSISDISIVFLKIKEGESTTIGAVLVDREESPYDSRELPHMGLKAFPTSELFFTDCVVPKENRIGGGASAKSGDLRMVFQAFEIMRTLMAVGSVAMAQASLDHSIAYAKQRRQWGKYLGEHQMIQEMIADMATQIDAARLLAYRALTKLQNRERCDREAAMAKYFATEMAVEVTSKAIQIHGANGLSEEFPVEKLFRDARMFTIPDGATQIQKMIVARDILNLSAFC